MKKLRDIIKRKQFFINSDGHAVPHDPITFKSGKKEIKEDVLVESYTEKHFKQWLNKNDNKHIAHTNAEKLSWKIISKQKI